MSSTSKLQPPIAARTTHDVMTKFGSHKVREPPKFGITHHTQRRNLQKN